MALTICGVLTACNSSANPPTSTSYGVAPGYMRVKVQLAGAPDVSKYKYGIVFNTTGNGVTPENGKGANPSAYSYGFLITSSGTSALAYVHNANPAIPPAIVPLQTTATQLQAATGSSSLTITFQRNIFSFTRGANVTPSWLFNVATGTSANPLDTMGSCGTCYSSPTLSVNNSFQTNFPAGMAHGSIPTAAKIVSVEITNSP